MCWSRWDLDRAGFPVVLIESNYRSADIPNTLAAAGYRPFLRLGRDEIFIHERFRHDWWQRRALP